MIKAKLNQYNLVHIFLVLILLCSLLVPAVWTKFAPLIRGAASIAWPTQSATPAAVTLRAASGATIVFKTQNGDLVDGVPSRTFDVPHLVLHRDGHLTKADERTLILEVTGIMAPSPGVTVTVEMETQHEDPDVVGDGGPRILVWRASQQIANPSRARGTGVTAHFMYEFGETIPYGTNEIATPSDYYRYEITLTDAGRPPSSPVYAFSEDHALLVENQWVVRLPEVREESPGAAPDELVVYYADMIPFRKDAGDPTTWLAREEVTDYVGSELLPQMVEAFRVQTDQWGFPWYPAWIGRRAKEKRRLSVALSDGETWFHGPAPVGKGLSDISINVSGGNATYDTVTDGLMSTFHHELFHSLQRNIHLHQGGSGWVSGQEGAWAFYAEGTAILASTVGQPQVQFAAAKGRDYMAYANRFVRWGGGCFQDLIANDTGFDAYYAAIYWRFLYEQCGGMRDGVRDPAAGMAIIRRVLTALYSGEVVDVDASTDSLGATPQVLDRALAGSSCPFQTYQESLVAFARAVYGLRVAGGRCVEPGLPGGCGLYDPYDSYVYPTVETIVFNGASRQYRGSISSNHGTDSVDVVFAPSAEGRPLRLEFYAPPTAATAFDVKIFSLADACEFARPRHNVVPGATAEICAEGTADGSLVCVIPRIRIADRTRLGLVITRLDGEEVADLAGQYTITLH